ncbi:unnamed protein product [Penicillium salamii]|uniref:Annexin n=1 Tax=Penicillium salamii TaxID=1612424 RepID=A0A9W4N627_9EURO|nr:unnamed protein product [Penicillium salamii]
MVPLGLHMPLGTGTLTSDKGRVLGQFEVEGAQYIFVGNLTGFGQSFSIPNADVAYESAEQLHKQSEEFEQLPVEKDQIQLRLKNGVAITGGFDMPFSDGEVKKGTSVGGGGKAADERRICIFTTSHICIYITSIMSYYNREYLRWEKSASLTQVEPPGGYAQQGPPGGPPQGYQQPHQPYGAPQGHYPPQGQYPPQQGGFPPQGHYGAPPQQGHYGAPSPQPPAGYHAPSPQPPYGHAPPNQPPPGAHGYPPQGQAPGGYGPPGGYPPQPPQVIPSRPSLGYIPGTLAPGDFRPQADALRKAMKGFGTDEKALIAVLAPLDPLQVAAVRDTFSKHLGRDLVKDVKSETSGYFEQGLISVINGPLLHDVESVHSAIDGAGTKEWLLNDILLGRSNADLNAIRTAYEIRYGRSLSRDVESDLSFGTSDLFATALRAARHEESAPVNPQTIEADVRCLQGPKNVKEVCAIFARSSDAEIRAINQTFQSRYNTSLEKHIEKEFSGHMEDALLHMLRTATDPAMRDAMLLEDCMSGMGTKDERLVVRAVRTHWDRNHKETVKRAYYHKFGKPLVERVRGETSGDYGRLMVALLE